VMATYDNPEFQQPKIMLPSISPSIDGTMQPVCCSRL
jgi:hypothetical protein